MPKDSRAIRIFISSTFHDMHAERDYLVRHAFPERRARFRTHQIELVEVDLRWGITRSQAESGKTQLGKQGVSCRLWCQVASIRTERYM